MVSRQSYNFTIHVCRVLCHTVLILRHITHPYNRNDARLLKQFLFTILHHPNVHISRVQLRVFFVQKFIYIYIILYNILGNAVNKIGLWLGVCQLSSFLCMFCSWIQDIVEYWDATPFPVSRIVGHYTISLYAPRNFYCWITSTP